jgi:beta-ribofuranosylaminobenzene 5'-phosphate synthase
MTVQVKAFPRIHIGLIDLSGTTNRAFGGAGFSVGGLCSNIKIDRSSDSTLSAPQLDDTDREDLWTVVQRWEDISDGQSINVEILEAPPQHVGLGSKTGMTLGILSGANKCWEEGLERDAIQKVSKRGGVSGIGINSFFLGGFIVDLGHAVADVDSFKPSSFRNPNNTPPISVRIDFPDDWAITLYLPEGERTWGAEELSFFEQNAPIHDTETKDTLAAIYHGVVPSFKTKNLTILSKSLDIIHNTGFKSREVENQPRSVRATIAILQDQQDVAAGMSSLGPLVYAVHRSGCQPDHSDLDNETDVIGPFKGRNDGAEIH